MAAKRTSSGPGVGRPSRMARVLAPRIRYCEARGPAPQLTQFLTNSSEPFSFGRVADYIHGVSDQMVRYRHPPDKLLEGNDIVRREDLVELVIQYGGCLLDDPVFLVN